MIIIHALWTDATLHVWGEKQLDQQEGDPYPMFSSASSGPGRTAEPLAIQPLQRTLGDLWDSLLVSGAVRSKIDMLLPHRHGMMLSSRANEGQNEHSGQSGRSLQRVTVDALSFMPADAVDLLTTSPVRFGNGFQTGASLGYWARVADLVLELLAKQRFVPSVHLGRAGDYHALWRVVVGDKETSQRLRALIAAMPPVCRGASGGMPRQAASLIENFLWTTVDALVRRCLEQDELAHALQDRSGAANSALMRWLRSLVHPDPTLNGSPEEQQSVYETSRRWLAELDPGSEERTCRTCFRLNSPNVAGDVPQSETERSWLLSFQVQALRDPTLIVDATRLIGGSAADPQILQRPFVNALEQLRADLAHAARHFPPLACCAEPNGPLQCPLTLNEAHRFLKDTAPVLKAEGFTVTTPSWWRERRPGLHMQLDIRPVASSGEAGRPTMQLDSLVAYDWRVALGDECLSTEEITRLAAAKEPLVRLRGRWTELETDDLQRALAFLGKQRQPAITIFEALRLSYLADDLDTGLPIAPLKAHGWIEAILDASDPKAPIDPVTTPAGFHGTLRDYQLRGLQWLGFLAKHGLGACLADDMGLGKTIQLIALLLLEREGADSSGPTLLIVPMSLVGNWQREVARFGPSLKVMVHHGLERLTGPKFKEAVSDCDLVISTYGLVPRDLEHLIEIDWHRVALDEAQKTKNPAAKQSQAIRMLRATQRVALTGTPVENRLSELWSIMDFLNRGYLGTVQEFRRKFAVPIERYHDTQRSERLRNLIRPFVLRRRKNDPGILDELPEKLERTVFCNLTSEQAALYEAVVSEMLGHIDSSGGIQRRGLILATLVKLKQICNHPAQFLRESGTLAHRSGKCDRITGMLEEVVAEGHRALVFTQFREMGHLLQRHLQHALGIKVLFLHGGTSQPARTAMVDTFQEGGDEPVFLLSLKAGGFGLNLTAANHAFLFDRWWNPAVEDQAADRAHRIGQRKQVQVHKFVCVGTLEERIADLIESKRALAENIVGGGEGWLTELSTDALRDILMLSQEAVVEDYAS